MATTIANLNLSITEDVMDYIATDVDSECDYMLCIPPEPRTIPVHIFNQYLPNKSNSVPVSRAGDNIFNIAAHVSRGQYCGFGRLARPATGAAGPVDPATAALNAAKAGLAAKGFSGAENLARKIVAGGASFDPHGTAEAVHGVIDQVHSVEEIATALAQGAYWAANPAEAEAAGYSLSTGARQGDDEAVEYVDNAPIPMRLDNAWCITLFAVLRAAVSTQVQEECKSMWAMIRQSCFKAPGQKLVVSQGIFEDSMEGERQAVAHCLAGGDIYCETPFYFNGMCYPLHMVEGGKIEISAELRSLRSLMRIARCDQYGNRIVPEQCVLQEVKNLNGLADVREITADTDISGCERMQPSDVETGFVVTYATYREDIGDALLTVTVEEPVKDDAGNQVFDKNGNPEMQTSEKPRCINHRATQTKVVSKPVTKSDTVPAKFPYFSRGFFVACRSNVAEAAGRNYDFSVKTINGAKRFPLATLDVDVGGDSLNNYTNAEFYHNYTHTLGLADVQENAGLYYVPNSMKAADAQNLNTGGLYVGRLGEVNFKLGFHKYAFDANVTSYTAFVINVATHIIQFAAKATGILFGR